MTPKVVKIYLEGASEPLVTMRSKINYHDWGVDAIITINEDSKKFYVPWANIHHIEEII